MVETHEHIGDFKEWSAVRMETAEFEDAKLLWKMFYAYQCFRRAEAAAQHILDERLEQESLVLR